MFASISDRLGVDLGAVLASQMRSRERTDTGKSSPWSVQDGLGIVLVRSLFRLTVWVRFFEPLGCLLESFWGVFGLVLGHLGLSWVRFWSSWALLGSFLVTPCSILESFNPICPSTHQLINPSTHGLSAPCNSGRRTARSD